MALSNIRTKGAVRIAAQEGRANIDTRGPCEGRREGVF